MLVTKFICSSVLFLACLAWVAVISFVYFCFNKVITSAFFSLGIVLSSFTIFSITWFLIVFSSTKLKGLNFQVFLLLSSIALSMALLTSSFIFLSSSFFFSWLPISLVASLSAFLAFWEFNLSIIQLNLLKSSFKKLSFCL